MILASRHMVFIIFASMFVWVFLCTSNHGLSYIYGEYHTAEWQKSCGYAGTTREEGLPYVKSVRKV